MYIADVKNVADYAEKYEYIVARPFEGKLWFWGAYSSRERAEEAARENNGVVLTKGENRGK